MTLRGDNASADVCFVGGVNAPVIPATVALGGGDDVFTVEKSPPCGPGTATTGQADWGVTVDGEGGADLLRGGSRDDTLLGGTDEVGVVNDLAGGAGPDVLLGGEGNDAINSRDGGSDPLIDCGPGTRDSATLDLVDRTRPSRFNLFPSPANCESVLFFATDDGPPGRLAQGVLRRDPAGVARVLLTCPRNARGARNPGDGVSRKGPRGILRTVRIR